MKNFIVIIALCFFISVGHTATIRVPQDQPTIQAGIDAASAGDMVEVAAGVYSENITLKDGIELVGAGADETIITASQGSVITADKVTEGTVEGFTIDGQDSCRYGIHCTETGPLLRIHENRVKNIWGDGIYCYYASPTISNNTITEVVFDGIYLNWSGPSITHNIITSVGINGIHSEVGTPNPPHIKGNTIEDTGSNGIFCHNDSSPLIEENIISLTGRHGIECHNRSSPIIRSNQIRFSSDDGVNCNGNSRPKLRENLIHTNSGNGVFNDADSFPNLGTDINPGLNQIYGNAKSEVNNENSSRELGAKGNWWGQTPPNENGFQGLVDYKPWLNSPPSDTIETRPAEIPIPRWDVNEDGIVDLFDIVLVASHFGESTIPAAMAAMRLSVSNRNQMLNLLAELEGLENQPHGTLIVIDFLRSLLNPEPVIMETKVFTNYPNPFNPETWIPYQLAAEADVEISIYSVEGQRIRTLQLGMQPSGEYITREKATYWDGRTDRSERVPSGAYFYHFRAGDYSATRKMLILK